MTNDPLKSLLLDADDVDRTRLARALKEVIGIDTKAGRIVLKPGFNSLTARLKIMAYLLGRKAAKLLKKNESESSPPKMITEETGIPSGTVKPTLRKLLEDRIISQTDSGEYYIAAHQMQAGIEELETEEKK